MRPHGPFDCEPQLEGTAYQCPFSRARYSATLLTGPYLPASRPITSSSGSRLSWWFSTSQVGNDCMSCPVRACSSAASVSRFLLPIVVMKSACTSTLVRSAKAATCLRITALPSGTQWSQKPTLSFPAAPAVRICTSGRAVAAAAVASARRRETLVLSILHSSPCGR